METEQNQGSVTSNSGSSTEPGIVNEAGYDSDLPYVCPFT